MTSAIPPLEPLRLIAAPDPTSAAAPTAVPAQVASGLGERFSQALAEARLVPEQGAHLQGPSAVSQAVSAQDQAFDAVTTKIDTFEASSGDLSIQQVMAQSLQIQREVTGEMVKIYAGTAVAQGGKSTVQTLMKNQ